MKSLKQIREASGGKEAYQKFFNSILKRFGVGSPAELEGDAKKKFYDAIDAGWDGDNEKPEPGDKKKNENTDDFKSDEDVPDDKGNYTMGDMAESPAIALKVAAAIDKKNEKKKSVKEIRVKPVDEKMGMCEQCGTMHEEGDCPQSNMDMSDLDPDTKGMEERAKGTASKKDLAKQAKMTAAMNRRKSYREGTEIKEKTKLKGGNGKAEIDINFDGDRKDIKFATTKYMVKIKPHRNGAIVTGDKKKILAYLTGQDYAMDDGDIEDLYPELMEMFSTRSLGLKGASKRSRDKARGSDLSSAELKKAEKIAKKHSGDMKKAMAEIEKIKKGSSESDAVMAILKKANEDTSEDMYMHTSKKKRKLKAHKGDHMDEANRFSKKLKGAAKDLFALSWKAGGKSKAYGDKEWNAAVDKMAAKYRDDNHVRISDKDIAAVKQAIKHESVSEAVSVDRRTMGFKEAMKRRAEAKAKREAAKIKAAKTQAKNDMASIDANYAYDGEVASILADANAKIMGEDAPANASSSGAVDMNTNGKSVKKKKDKENLMAKYGY